MSLKIKHKIKNFLGEETYTNLFHTKNYLTANIVTEAVGFLLLPIKTRLLIPADYGILSIFTSTSSIFKIFSDLGFYGSVNRYYHEKNNDFDLFLKNVLSFIVLFNLLILGTVFACKNYLGTFFNLNSQLVFYASLAASFNVPISIYLAYLNGANRSKDYSNISIIKFILVASISIIWMFLIKETRYMGSIYTNLIINLIFAVIFIIVILSRSKKIFKMNFKHIKYSLSFGLPLIPHALSGVILSYFDRIIINQLNGPKDAGLYSFAYNIGMIMYIIVMSFAKMWNPIFYKKMNERKYNEIQSLALVNIGYIYIFAFALLAFSKELVIIMSNKNYYDSLTIVPVIILGYVLVNIYTYYVAFELFEKKTIFISINTLAAGIVNIVLNYIYIPQFGYKIAAMTTLVSYLLLLLLHYLTVKYILKREILRLESVLVHSFPFMIIVGIKLILKNQLNQNYLVELAVKLVMLSSLIYFYLIRKPGGGK